LKEINDANVLAVTSSFVSLNNPSWVTGVDRLKFEEVLDKVLSFYNPELKLKTPKSPQTMWKDALALFKISLGDKFEFPEGARPNLDPIVAPSWVPENDEAWVGWNWLSLVYHNQLVTSDTQKPLRPIGIANNIRYISVQFYVGSKSYRWFVRWPNEIDYN
jgi:hypothetical protein